MLYHEDHITHLPVDFLGRSARHGNDAGGTPTWSLVLRISWGHSLRAVPCTQLVCSWQLLGCNQKPRDQRGKKLVPFPSQTRKILLEDGDQSKIFQSFSRRITGQSWVLVIFFADALRMLVSPLGLLKSPVQNGSIFTAGSFPANPLASPITQPPNQPTTKCYCCIPAVGDACFSTIIVGQI